MTLSLSAAQTIITAALAEARARKARSLGVMVLDAGGHPIAFAREDGASMYRFDVARAKAKGALGLGENTRAITEKVKSNPLFFQSLSAVVGGDVVFSPGGVLIYQDGAIIGSVGISGDTGDCDEECAIIGIRAAGFDVDQIAA